MKSKSGYTLIEVMISLLLMGLMIYFFDAVQLTASRVNYSAYYLTQAVIQIKSMKERLIALKNYSGLTQQLSKWNEQNSRVLPKAQGLITGQYPVYQIKLCWQQRG